jgi:16S rRNA (cytosine967-C5)-methyltransferase
VATPARALALRVLCDAERGPGTLSDRLARPDVGGLDPRERGFLHALVLGTLRNRGAIDHALRPLLDRPLERVDREILQVLRLGAHQLLHLRVPARAAVDESVGLARARAPRGAGFVNAVLRRLAREGPPPEPADPQEWLVSAGSLPAWLAERWLRRLGAHGARELARRGLEEPPAVFRLNPRIPDALERAREAGLQPHALDCPGAFRAEAGRPADLHAAGVLYLQDELAQRIGLVTAGPGRTLDACAAPGGKAMLIADAVLADGGKLVAAEASQPRLATLSRLAALWGCPNLAVVGADAARPPFPAPSFDQVLLDAPCSGLGTIARNPDLRWRVREADLAAHGRRQLSLLSALAPLVRPGGRLVYATCSTEPEENADVVAAFLARDGSFRLEPAPPLASGLDGSAGFFASVLRRA